ncbi:S8 family peptidase [Methylophilus glucosoxydans]|uniref:S8 family peptidase n=1 Tax=Methylophilus glucosoxydans TaxID=752553 RepID=A0ABW3GJZ9_9PROT
MAEQPENLPLLLFPQAGRPLRRESLQPSPPRINLPSSDRQGARLSPKFQILQNTIEARNVALANNPGDNPELVLIFEIVGRVDEFIRAVSRINDLDWLAESINTNIQPDNDFYDSEDETKPLDGRLFLIGTNLQALRQIHSLWLRYVEDSNVSFERGLGRWKDVFKRLKDVRFWSATDRLPSEVIEYWNDKLETEAASIKFEIEAWCYESENKNQSSIAEITTLVERLNGRVLSRALIKDIAYHGFLVEMPSDSIRRLLSNLPPELVLSDRVMFFRPIGQSIAERNDDSTTLAPVEPSGRLPNGPPVIALLDGLPLQNHPNLAGRIILDDPDGWEATYEANDRNHGTEMASLISMGDLDGPSNPLKKPLYVRPVLKPVDNALRSPRDEVTPNDVLLIDLIHRSVKRIFESDGNTPPVAPSVKIINLSLGYVDCVFDNTLSPWARLLDWLSYKYKVLFIVSAGNLQDNLVLDIPRDTISNVPLDQRNFLAIRALLSDSFNRRLISPAESINSLTIGAIHDDLTTVPPPPRSFDVFTKGGISPISRIGHGYLRAVKPDLLFPGGKILYKPALQSPPDKTVLTLVRNAFAPGHRVAAPISGTNSTKFTRGTSNATALATRAAGFAHEVIETLRTRSPNEIPANFDAVLIKALLAHGAEWGTLESMILNSFPEVTDHHKKSNLISRNVGYGIANVDKSLSCTQQRVTVIGVGAIGHDQSLTYRLPLPPSLRARTLQRKLTVTLAWLSPVNPKNAKYRSARLWVDPNHEDFGTARVNCDWRHVKRGTLQHEICVGNQALAFVDGDDVAFTVNCTNETVTLFEEPIEFAICVTLEVAQDINVQLYNEVRDRIRPRVPVEI